MASEERHFILIAVDEAHQLVRLEDIYEVVPSMELTRIEGASQRCLGILNLRGEMVPIFSSREEADTLALSQIILVSRAGEEVVGLVVDDVLDIITLSADRVARRSLGGGRSAIFVRMDDEQVLRVLEPEALAA
jgi:purine-binding chemotaxis protein CheW